MEWEEGGVWNDMYLVGFFLCIVDQFIVSLKVDVSKDVKDLLVGKGWLSKILEKWYWNKEVMESVVFYVERWVINLGQVFIYYVY